MKASDIKILLEQQLSKGKAIVTGEDGQHFAAIVISPAFIGKTRVQQQQQVYAILGDYIAAGEIHALTLKTFTPEAWEAAQSG
jgi:acid stress-induced BolA-like protein IbaG/YrbA